MEKSFYLSPTEDSSPEESLSDSSKELHLKSMVFSIVLCLVRTKTIKRVRNTFLQGFKKTGSAPTQGISMALAPGKGVLSLKEDQHWCPRNGGI